MPSPASPAYAPASSRRLSQAHLAYVRCWAEGLDLVDAWNRYLYVDGAGDGRRARGELQRLLDQLRSLARAHARPDIAILLRRDPQAIVQPLSAGKGPAPPSLEEFAAEQPEDFYTEAELIALYEEQFGSASSRSAARRRQRLRERLVLAIQWLTQVGARAPQRI
ncbi:MAG: hypothetical protein J0M00_11575, partial [Burkholderiales bacterium]|nr:hypothetical protein [Burkholderiales bacterium]